MDESSDDDDLAALLEEAEEEDDGEEDEEEGADEDAEEDAEEELQAALDDPADAAGKELEGAAEKEEALDVQKGLEDAALDDEVDSELERDAAGGMDAELIAELEVAGADGQEEEDGGEAEDEDDAEDLNEDAEEEENADGAEDMADGADQLGEDGGDAAKQESKKRRGKPKDPHAPKRPLIPYRQFCAEARPKLLEEKPELRSDLKGMTQALAAGFAEVPTEKKEEMQRAYDEEKVKYDELMAEYRKSDSYKAFQKDFAAWRDAKDVKKLQKKQKASAPKKPQSGYWAFAAAVREDMKRDSPGLSMGELGKKVAERWAALPAEERRRYIKDSCVARQRWDEEMKTYRHSAGYRAAVDEMAELEIKQGLRRLKTDYDSRIPKRPANAMMIYCAEANVKGSFTQKIAKFKELTEEQQRLHSEEAHRLATKYRADMDAFLASKAGQIYTRKAASIKHNAKVRAARLKHLVDAPKRPPNAKALFIQRKREEFEAMEDCAESATALAARAVKLWESTDEAARQPFEEEAARLAEQFEKAMNDFKEGDAYRELMAVVSKAPGGRAKARAGGKARAKAKGKAKAKAKSKARAKASSLVARPESMPAKPPNAYQLHCKEQQSAGKTASRASFAALSHEEAKRLSNEVLTLQKKYTEDLGKFMKSKEGKQYKRKLEAAGHKQKVARAKEKLKEEEPTKPLSSFRLFAASTKGGTGCGRPAERWTQLSEEDRKHWDLEHEKQMAEYEKAMDAFRKTAAYKKFQRAANAVGKAGAKMLSKPESMPKRPLNPFAIFMGAMAGKGLDHNALVKAWADLGTEGQQKFKDQANDAKARYKQDMDAWRKTADGKKVVRAESKAQTKRTEERLKEKHLKAPNAPEPPEKPKSAKMLFLEERRKQILKDEGPKAGGPRELAARLIKEWDDLTVAAKKVWEDKERSLLDVYEFEMEEYTSSEAYQKYSKAIASKGVGKGKGKARKSQGGKRKAGELSFDSDEMGSDSSSSDSDGISD